ncbi:hypothetical protein [Lactobacillus delbrueckii]|nr:hypothetical protein [Lactobacillus delbrueckii]ADQ60707.1 Hypothetical protein LDBND_0660 [Lactobacillus delbrueckii subsp. bulgaricus ND02]
MLRLNAVTARVPDRLTPGSAGQRIKLPGDFRSLSLNDLSLS